MNHLPVHINRDIKRDKTQIMAQQYIQLITQANEIDLLNPGGLKNRLNIKNIKFLTEIPSDCIEIFIFM